MRAFARVMLVFAGLWLTAGAVRAQSIDIPLNLTVFGSTDPIVALTINVGINGRAPRPYIFDTGSAIFVAYYTMDAFGMPSTMSGGATDQHIRYGDDPKVHYGYDFNVVGTSSLTFYPSYTSTAGGVVLTAISPSGAPNQFLMGAITKVINLANPLGALPGVFSGEYGNFGAGNFLLGEPGSVLGQAVVPGTTAGYVVAANGQPLNAADAGSANQPYTNTTNGPQHHQSVTACSPCVMLGLTPALIAQFMPVNTMHTDTAGLGNFANSGVPATSETPISLNIEVSAPGHHTRPVLSESLLDTGTGFYVLPSSINPSRYAGGNATLTISGSASGATQSSVTLIGNTGPAICCNPYFGEQSPPGSSTIGIGFFLNNSVLYNLAGAAVGYTPNFVTDVNITTAPTSPQIFDANSVPLGLAGVISGSGPVEILSGGSATLSGTNTYTGATIVNNGFLALVGPGSISMSSGVSISNSGVFDVSGVGSGLPTGAYITSLSSTDNLGIVQLGANQLILTNANGTFAGSIQDGGLYGGTGGSLALAGGNETLTGVNTYTGSTVVLAGMLTVNGSIASSALTIVGSGGTLAGAGIVGPVFVLDGGAFAPAWGAPGAAMTVAGDLLLSPGSFYGVQLTSSTASPVNISGNASLAGTVTASLVPGNTIYKQYDILHGAGLGGTSFGAVVTNAPGFSVGLSYSATDVYLGLNAVLSSLTSTFGTNAQHLAQVLDATFNTTGSLPPGLTSLYTLSGSGLSSALTQSSGESATGAQQTTFQAMGQFLNLLTDPFMGRGSGVNGWTSPTGYADGDGSASAYASSRKLGAERDAYAMFTKAPLAKVYEPRWSVWASGFGGSQSTDGNAAVGSNSTTSSIYGTAIGAEYLLSPRTIAGFALAGGGTSFSVVNSGGGRSDLFQAGAYIRHTAGNAYVTAALAYGWQDVTTDRYVTFAGLDHLRAEFNANAWSGRLEGGYRFVAPVIGGIGITPYAAGQFTTFDLPAYAESVVVGTPNFALAYGGQSVTDTRSELGVRTDKSYAVQNGVLTLRSRFAWAHDFDPNRNVAATFEALPGASFVVGGAAQASESALATLSAEMKWRNGWAAAATFEGEFSQVTASYAGKGVVRYVW